ncbi:MAG: hypothetical protein AAF557_22915 [Pseudomonadota bacterium]
MIAWRLFQPLDLLPLTAHLIGGARIKERIHMFDPQDRSWLAQSLDASNAKVEIGFFVSGEFYRDPNNTEEKPLPLPTIGSLQGDARYLFANDAIAETQQLIEYYKQILTLATKYSQTYDEINHYFSLRLQIVSQAGEIGFPWYDHREEIDGVLDWLISSQDGDQWHDLEQGWEVIVVRRGTKLHFREGAFDQGGEQENLAFSGEELSSSIAQTRSIMSELIPKLVREIGEDYWTRFRYDLSSH